MHYCIWSLQVVYSSREKSQANLNRDAYLNFRVFNFLFSNFLESEKFSLAFDDLRIFSGVHDQKTSYNAHLTVTSIVTRD